MNAGKSKGIVFERREEEPIHFNISCRMSVQVAHSPYSE